MKKYVLLIVATLVFFSCQKENSNTYTIEGKAPGLEDGTKIMFYSIESGITEPKLLDSVFVNKGEFKAALPKSETPSINYLSIKKLNRNIIFFPDADKLEAHIYKDSVEASFVAGGPDNTLYKKYLDQAKKIGKERSTKMAQFSEARKNGDNTKAIEIQKELRNLAAQENAIKKDIVTNNPNSIFSALLISELVSQKAISGTEAKEIISKFSSKIASSPLVQDITKLISASEKAEVGLKAPSFSAPTPDGKMLSLEDAMGKYTIIDFWASWCKPCRMENPNVVKVYNKYHDKGLNIISVSLDKEGQKDRWIKAIADDKLTWNHVSNLKFWSEPIAQMYNVRSIPATFLLDEKGVIIAKNLRGKALEDKIASLLGE
jgi:thiol-disulfide isomerase/thioredoxin